MAKAQPIDIGQPAEDATPQVKRPAHWRENHGSGFEGREALLGQAMSMVIKTLNQTEPYQHIEACRPRLEAYAKDMGVEFRVSDLRADGTVSCEVV